MTVSTGSDPSLADILTILWRARQAVLAGALAGAVLCLILLLFLPSLYRGVMIVAPADGYALGDYASAPQGTAAAGPYDKIVSLPFWRPMEAESVSTDCYRFVQTARGPSVAEILLKDQAVKAALPEKATRNAASFAEYLARKVDIQPIGTTPLRRLTYYHADEQFAAAFPRKIHLVADQLIRRDRRRMAQSRIAYLGQSLARTANPDHRRIITGLLMQQEHILMLANLDEPYAAIIVEPAAASARPVWPDRPLMFGGFVLAGALIGYAARMARRQA